MKPLLILLLLTGLFVARSNAQVSVNSDGSAPDNSAMLDVKSINKGILTPRITHAEMEAIPDPADGLIVYCTDCSSTGGGALAIFIGGNWKIFTPGCLNPLAPLPDTHTTTGNQIVWNWYAVAAASGYKWNTINEYASATDMGTATSKTETGLNCNTAYSRYVWAYNSCGYSSASILSQTTGSVIAGISIIASSNPACQGIPVTFTATPINGGANPSYQWKVNGINSGQNNPVYTYIPVNNDVVTCVLTSSDPFVCGNPAISNVLTMTVSSNPIPIITGLETTCKDTPGNVYSTESGMTGYTWTVSGGTITAGTGTNSITVTWTSAGIQQVTVNYINSNGCQANTPTAFPVTVLAPTITGPTSVCKLDPGKTYTTEAGKTNYIWTYTGATKTAGGNGFNFVTLTWIAAGSRSVKVSYTDGSCTSNTTLPVMVYNTLPAIAGPNQTCIDNSSTYTTDAGMVAGSYLWTVSAGNSIISGGGSNDNTCTVMWNVAGSQWITVTYASPAGCAITPATMYVTVLPYPYPPTEGAHSPLLTQIVWNWNNVSGAAGYKWNTTNDYPSATDMGTVTTKTETGLTYGTSYTRFAWAYNACGNSAPLTLTASTLPFTCGPTSLTVDHVAGTLAPVSKTVTYGTVTNIAGEASKCWITSNLGADHQAAAANDGTEASAGWYWQFNHKQGYKHDGVTRIPNTAWISSISESSDWITANDPCALELGNGWRIPTITEWNNVDATGNWNNWDDPFNSVLKMHTAGQLYSGDGSLSSRGVYGKYWSSSQNIVTEGSLLVFGEWSSNVANDYKANGFPIRCIRD